MRTAETRLALWCVVASLAGVHGASGQPRTPPQDQPAYATSNPTQGTEAAAEPAEEAETYPVLAVTSVEVLRSTVGPPTDIVVVNGVTSADGWSNGELVPLRHGKSTDGVLDLVFVADAPKESAGPTGYLPIQAILPLSEGHPFKAIRVRGATNSLLVRDLPGHVEAPPPAQVCSSCVGKTFVAKDGAASGGGSDVLREDALPPNARVVHQADGIADMQHNPNRLTIIVGEDGRVADAAWE